MLWLFLAVLGCTASACPHAIAYQRGSQEELVESPPPLGVGRPLTKLPRHRLHVVGYGLDLDTPWWVLCPVESS